jgi:GTP pyrophosphokinase
MRTLHGLDAQRQQRVARETMEIYAPLAHRLGLGTIAQELEDLAFQYLEPEAFQRISDLLTASQESRARYVAQIEKLLRYELSRQDIVADMSGRAKSTYSIHLKMQKYVEMGKSFNDIYDLIAIGAGARWPTAIALGVVRDVAPFAGAVRRLHRQPAREHLPIAATDGTRRASLGGADPNLRDAPHGRIRCRGALALQRSKLPP